MKIKVKNDGDKAGQVAGIINNNFNAPQKKHSKLERIYFLAGILGVIGTLVYGYIALIGKDMKEKNQTINVKNTGNNVGQVAGVINNNFAPLPRHLDDSIKKEYLKISRQYRVNIAVNFGDVEALNYANEIKSFLVSNGYTVDGVNNVWIVDKPLVTTEYIQGNTVFIEIGPLNPT